MSDNPVALFQPGTQLPSVLQSLMEATTSSEMQANVGASFAVVSIKGKVFNIKYGGHSTPITINMNGQLYASPYFDCVIPKASANLSKTWYPTGYTEGSDEQPTCWSEDAVTPLAPMNQRPTDPATGAPCIDCRGCPNNQFGSKITDNGSRAKACSDTRKVIILPVDPATGMMDGDNIKFGGAMLLRVPAGSLRAFADYDAKLQQMGVPYYGVVTRMEFDQTEAFPKFVLKALRPLTDAEAARMLEVRDGVQVKQILSSGQTGAAPTAPVPALPPPAATQPTVTPVQGTIQQPATVMAPPVAPQLQPAPTQQILPQMPVQPAPMAQPQQAPLQQAPLQQAPLQQLPPQAPPPPVQAAPPPPPPVAFPPAGWTAHPQAPGYWYKDQTVLSEADLRAQTAAAVPPAPPAPSVLPPQQGGPLITQSLLNTVDSLLAT